MPVEQSSLLSYMEATPTRIRQYLWEEHNLEKETIEKIMTDHEDHVKLACTRKILTYSIGDALQLLNNGAP